MHGPGILSFGAYLPRLRLERAAIAEATGWATGLRGGKTVGCRSYCAWDEDSLTMAVEAARSRRRRGRYAPKLRMPGPCIVRQVS